MAVAWMLAVFLSHMEPIGNMRIAFIAAQQSFMLSYKLSAKF